MDRNLVPCLLEGPCDPMRLGAIGGIETDEELLSHRNVLICPADWSTWNVSLRLADAPRTLLVAPAGASYRRPQSREYVAVGYPGSKGERVQLIKIVNV